MKSAGRYSLIYLLAGTLWILVSDRLVHQWFEDSSREIFFHTYKGLLYVLLSGLLVYYLIQQSNKSLLKEKNSLQYTKKLLKTITDNTGYELLLFNTASRKLLIRNHVLSKKNREDEDLDDFLKSLHFNQSQSKDVHQIILESHEKETEFERDFIALYGNEEKQYAITFIPVKTDDTKKHMLLMIKDVTESLGKDRLTRLYQEKLALIMESEEIGFWDWTPPNATLKLNPSLKKIIGLGESEQITQKDWISRLHINDRKEVEEGYRLYFLGETDSYEGEYRLKTGEDTYKWIVEYARVIERNDAGEPQRILGVVIDFDRVKGHEDTINTQARLLREFAFSNSHKVRAPLARILGLVKLVLETKHGLEHNQDPELLFILSKIDESAEELDKVLQDFASKLNDDQLKTQEA